MRALLIARMVNRIGGFSMAFLAVLITRELSATVQTAALIVAAFGLASIPSRLAGGWLMDRSGPRVTILLGLVGCALAQLAIAVAPTVPLAAGGAVVLGLAYELIEPPTQALIAEQGDDRTRSALFGLLFLSMTIAAVAAGGIAAVVAGWNLRLLFGIDALTCLICAAVVRGFLPPGERRKAAPVAARPWRDGRFLAVFALASVFTVIHMIVVFGLPLSVSERGIGLWVIGVHTVVTAVVAVAAQPLLRSPRLNRYGGTVGVAVGLLLIAGAIAVLAGAYRPWPVLASGVLAAVGEVLVMSHLYAWAARLAPAGAAGRYLALFGVSWGVATAVAPLLLGAWLPVGGGVGLWLATAIATALLAAVTPLLHRWVRTG